MIRLLLAKPLPRLAARKLLSTSTPLHKEFFKNHDAFNHDLIKTVVGETISNELDMTKVRPGDVIDVPYEITISHSLRDFWQSAFYSHDRINTSTPFARELNLQDQVLPFHLMLFLAESMSHADHVKVQTGLKHANYLFPAFAGDTFKKRFIIRSLRSTSDGRHSIIKIDCEIRNQRGFVVFVCEKSLLFPFKVPPSDVVVKPSEEDRPELFLNHMIQQTEKLQNLGSQTLTSLRPGQLVVHTLTRPLSETHMMQLATLGRLTHERHFNTRKFRREELLIPGGLVLGLTTSIASRDLHEVLHERLLECCFPNNLTPGDAVGAVSYVSSREEHVTGDFEALNIRTLGFKNLDVQSVMSGRALPIELLAGPATMRPRELEELLKRECPDLCKLVVCVADRRVYRQTPKQTPFLL